METLKILNNKGKKQIQEKIFSQFGCEFKLDCVLFMNSKNKIFMINNDISKINLNDLRINNIGMYFGELKEDLRLSIEGSQIIGKFATKNVIILDDKEVINWMAGEDLSIDSDNEAYVIIKHKDDFLGCGRLKNQRLLNYVPKERRTKVQEGGT